MSARDRKVALVTGAARGIGRACALDLARSGCHLALVDLLDAELERTADDVRALGGEAVALLADVASYAGEVVEEVATRFGRVDVLVNNAGRSAPACILEITEDEFDAAVAVNLTWGRGLGSLLGPDAAVARCRIPSTFRGQGRGEACR